MCWCCLAVPCCSATCWCYKAQLGGLITGVAHHGDITLLHATSLPSRDHTAQPGICYSPWCYQQLVLLLRTVCRRHQRHHCRRQDQHPGQRGGACGAPQPHLCTGRRPQAHRDRLSSDHRPRRNAARMHHRRRLPGACFTCCAICCRCASAAWCLVVERQSCTAGRMCCRTVAALGGATWLRNSRIRNATDQRHVLWLLTGTR